MRTPRVAIVGAGVGGLASAALLAARGIEVIVFERASEPGGKIHQTRFGTAAVDAGPTVFTMRWVFEEIFRAAGASLAERIQLRPLDIIARHAWGRGETLDLFAAEDQSFEAIRQFAGAREADGFRDFLRRAAAVYQTLERPFLRSSRPTPLSLTTRIGLSKLPELLAISPFSTLWNALGEHFRDPRLRQLFARYSTYCGSSPFLAPATLMLIAHVEQSGVWRLAGGMGALAAALAELARENGAQFRYNQTVDEILVERGRTVGVRTRGGERFAADTVIFNGDIAALEQGLLGQTFRSAAPPYRSAPDSLSALTFACIGTPEGFPLAHHNVFFSADYRGEFEDLITRRKLPADPTVYICAQDRGSVSTPPGAERLLCLVNAPPERGGVALSPSETQSCEERMARRLERSGLTIQGDPQARLGKGPAEFGAMFPATGGALYGRASHGWRASFARPGARSRIPGLYLAGGSVHPGPGVPMAALSGHRAAEAVMADLTSRFPSRREVTPGGTLTRSAMTGASD